MAPSIATAAARLREAADGPEAAYLSDHARALLHAVEAALASPDAMDGLTPDAERAWWRGHTAGHAAGLAARAPEAGAVDAGRLAWEASEDPDECDWFRAGGLVLLADSLDAAPCWWGIRMSNANDDAADMSDGYAPTREAARQAAAEAAAQLARDVLAALAPTAVPEAAP